MAKRPIDKGGLAEEAIRHAFLRRGYFAVRGLQYRFEGYDITDVDIFLYGLTGSGRETLIVDVKNKKTPQVMERIFWALGLRDAVRANRCLVATSETNPSIVDFGQQFGVTVLDGHFLKEALDAIPAGRLSEEALLDSLYSTDAERFSTSLLNRYKNAKSRLLTLRGFDACNAYLRDVSDSMRDLLDHPARQDSTRRVLLVLASFLCISLDMQWSELDFVDIGRRSNEFEKGLRYGSAGRQRIDNFIHTLRNCRSEDTSVQQVVDSIEHQIEADVNSLRTTLIADFVGKQGSELFPIANVLERSAFATTSVHLSTLPPPAKGFLLMLADYLEYDRAKLIQY